MSEEPQVTLAEDIPTLPIARISVEDYHRMIEAGALADQSVELLDGWLVPKMNHGSPHARVVRGLTELLVPRFVGTELMAQCQLPITLERSEPEPDLAVVHRSVAADRHPGLDEIVVAIEVANSSSRFDLTTKARIYAQAGIPTYLVVDVVTERVVHHSRPGDEGYELVAVLHDGDAVDVAGLALTAEQLLVRDT
ncbi:MAG: Uma2 family endonuclease [Actinomycetota bacterium]